MTDKRPGGIESFHVGFSTGEGPQVKPVDNGDMAPFRVLAIGEYMPRSEFARLDAPVVTIFPIDRYSIDSAISASGVDFAIDITDPVDKNDKPLSVNITWTEIKSMRPELLLDKVPVLAQLIEARRLLQAASEGRANAASLETKLLQLLPRPSWVAAIGPVGPGPTTPSIAKNQSPLDHILGQVDLGTSTASRAPNVGTALERIDRMLVHFLDGILNHPEVRRLERLWRSLKLLTERADAKKAIELFAIPVRPDQYDEVLQQLVAMSGETRFDLVLLDVELDTSARSIENAKLWASCASAMHTPIVVAVHPSALGATSVEELAHSQRSFSTADHPAAIALRALASDDNTAWLVLAINGVLLRVPYDSQTSRVRDFPYVENGTALFASASLGIALLCMKSQSEVEWPCALAAPTYVGSLPLLERSDGAFSTEALIGDDVAKELGKAGIFTVLGAKNRDLVSAVSTPVLFRGSTTGAHRDRPAPMRLGDQLFVARVANMLADVAGELSKNRAKAKAIQDVTFVTFNDLFLQCRPRPEVSANYDENARRITLNVNPKGFAQTTLPEFSLSASIT